MKMNKILITIVVIVFALNLNYAQVYSNIDDVCKTGANPNTISAFDEVDMKSECVIVRDTVNNVTYEYDASLPVGSRWVTNMPSNINAAYISKLTDSQLNNNAQFGWDIAIDLPYAVVSANQKDRTSTNTGSVYLLKKSDGIWSIIYEQINPFEGISNNNNTFGYSVDIQYPYVVANTSFSDVSGANSGTVHLFKVEADTLRKVFDYEQPDYVSPTLSERWGHRLKLYNNYLLIGHSFDRLPDTLNLSGSVYLNKIEADTIRFLDKKYNPRPSFSGAYAASISMNNDYALVGAWGDDAAGTNWGVVDLYRIEADTLRLVDSLFNSFPQLLGNNNTLDITPSNKFVAGISHDSEILSNGGAVFFGEIEADSFKIVRKIIPDDLKELDIFGVSSKLNDSIIVVGAFFVDDKGVNSGAFYLYRTSDQQLIGKYYEPIPVPNNEFGYNVAIDSASTDFFVSTIKNGGSVYSFEVTESSYSYEANVQNANIWGEAKFKSYGQGNITGTPEQIAMFDADGNLIETRNPIFEYSTVQEPAASSGIRYYYNTDDNEVKISKDGLTWEPLVQSTVYDIVTLADTSSITNPKIGDYAITSGVCATRLIWTGDEWNILTGVVNTSLNTLSSSYVGSETGLYANVNFSITATGVDSVVLESFKVNSIERLAERYRYISGSVCSYSDLGDIIDGIEGVETVAFADSSSCVDTNLINMDFELVGFDSLEYVTNVDGVLDTTKLFATFFDLDTFQVVLSSASVSQVESIADNNEEITVSRADSVLTYLVPSNAAIKSATTTFTFCNNETSTLPANFNTVSNIMTLTVPSLTEQGIAGRMPVYDQVDVMKPSVVEVTDTTIKIPRTLKMTPLSDADEPVNAEGLLWYNTTTDEFRVSNGTLSSNLMRYNGVDADNGAFVYGNPSSLGGSGEFISNNILKIKTTTDPQATQGVLGLAINDVGSGFAHLILGDRLTEPLGAGIGVNYTQRWPMLKLGGNFSGTNSTAFGNVNGAPKLMIGNIYEKPSLYTDISMYLYNDQGNQQFSGVGILNTTPPASGLFAGNIYGQDFGYVSRAHFTQSHITSNKVATAPVGYNGYAYNADWDYSNIDSIGRSTPGGLFTHNTYAYRARLKGADFIGTTASQRLYGYYADVTDATENWAIYVENGDTKLENYIFNSNQDTTGKDGQALRFNSTTGEIELQEEPQTFQTYSTVNEPTAEIGKAYFNTDDNQVKISTDGLTYSNLVTPQEFIQVFTPFQYNAIDTIPTDTLLNNRFPIGSTLSGKTITGVEYTLDSQVTTRTTNVRLLLYTPSTNTYTAFASDIVSIGDSFSNLTTSQAVSQGDLIYLECSQSGDNITGISVTLKFE